MKNINTLKNTLQFKEVYNKGRSLADKYLVIYALPDEGVFRLGISVSKKVGNSVERHRITRLIRESYLHYKDIIPDGYSVVIVARSAVSKKGYREVEHSFFKLLKGHKIIGEQNVS